MAEQDIQQQQKMMLMFADMVNNFILSLNEEQMGAFIMYLTYLLNTNEEYRTIQIAQTVGTIKGLVLAENKDISLSDIYTKSVENDKPNVEVPKSHGGMYL